MGDEKPYPSGVMFNDGLVDNATRSSPNDAVNSDLGELDSMKDEERAPPPLYLSVCSVGVGAKALVAVARMAADTRAFIMVYDMRTVGKICGWLIWICNVAKRIHTMTSHVLKCMMTLMKYLVCI